MNPKKIIKGTIYNSMFRFVRTPCKVLIINDGALGDFIHGLPFVNVLKDAGYDITILTNEKFKSRLGYKITDNYDIIDDKSFKMIFLMNEKVHYKKYWFKNVFDFNARRSVLKGLGMWKEKHWADFYLFWVEDFLKKKIKYKHFYKSTKEDIVFHPGSSNSEKNWDIQNFIDVYKAIKYDNKYFIIGPDDKHLIPHLEYYNCDYIVSDSINQLLEIASKTMLFIGNDSGVGHVFSLFDIKILSIFTIGCGETHFPFNKNAVFYFDYHVFKKYLVMKKIIKIKLTSSLVIHIINKILNDQDICFYNVYYAKNKAKHL